MRKHGLPERNELVVCEITRINPNSAYALLLEYERTGMIHVSEVAKRWVRNITEFVKMKQLVVCRVLRVDDNYISLSIKRVHSDQADRKLQEFKKERNAEKFLEQVGKQFGISIEETYEEVGHALQDEFGSLHKTFEIALKNPDLIHEKGIEKKWADAIIDSAEKNYVKKIYEVKATLTLISYASDGLEVIKKALNGIIEKGMEVRYISASKYEVVSKGEEVKEIKILVEELCSDAVKSVETSGGEGSFSLEEK